MNRLLVANRGEIAVRIMRTCKTLGLETVAVYSQADRESLHVQLADRAVCIGGPRAAESYLNLPALVMAALGTRCDAVHPGYGFLAESADFARACEQSGLAFIGPRPDAIRMMGNKIEARRLACEIGIPVVPGSGDALAIARRIGYQSLGTVEFVYDPASDQAYFLEMNTRIQVERPVTEMVTGLDLVAEQLHVARHGRMRISQEQVALRGHAIECRINAESPWTFRPAPGRITRWSAPEGAGIRVDSHCYESYVVPPYYDSLIAKLVVWGHTREEAVERLRQALAGFTVEGVETTLPFHRRLLDHPRFRRDDVHTRWIEEELLHESRVA